MAFGLPFDTLPAAEQTRLGRLVWDPATQELTPAPTSQPEPVPAPATPARATEQFGGEGQPAFVADINGQRVTAGRMVRDPNTGLLEPDYGDVIPPMEQPALPDPITLAATQSKAAVDQATAMFNSKRVELQNSIRPDEESAWRDAQIDLRTINESNLDADQKKQRIRQLQADYEKKVYGIRDKIRGDLAGLAQMEEQTRSKIELERLTTEAGLRHVAAFGKDVGAPPEAIARWQYKALGIQLPEPAKQRAQTPVQRLVELRPILHRAIEEAGNYRPHPTKKGVWQKLNPAKKAVHKNMDLWYETIADPDETAAAAATHVFLEDVQAQVDELERVVVDKPQPSLLLSAEHTASPLAAGVQQAKPKSASPQTAPRISTDAEYDALPRGTEFIDPRGIRRRKP